ncbi:hypothetical protein NFI96_010881 [Prochilodus magdalenae]|nr:hypothetical protein NFI96_010881 [Prochilodus magdalenae]
MNQNQEKEEKEKVKVSCIVMRDTPDVYFTFIISLSEKLNGLNETSVKESDVVLVFCPVGSGAGTDAEAVQQELNNLPGTKSAAVVFLHHTSDPDYPVPNSSERVSRKNSLTVDCLYKDSELLECQRNKAALESMTQWIERMVPVVRGLN